jgi:hypothetical protein
MRGLQITVGVGLSLLLSGWVLSGCASSPSTVTYQEPAIYSNEDPDADFSTYRTYNYVEPLAIVGADEALPLVGTFVVNAINREMKLKGFTQSDNPDLLMNVALTTKTTVAVGSSQVQRVVWEGLAQGYMRTEVREVTQERVYEVVRLIFTKFSHRAP